MVTGGKESGGKAAIYWEPVSPSAFTSGQTYSRDEIATQLGGSPREYLPRVDTRIVCGCFTLDHNPEAPNVIVPGTGPVIEEEARLFCEQKHAVPVFLKRQPNAWEYVGNYKVDRFSTDPREIAAHHQGSITPLNEITRVIFLKRT
jgi:hypothetical protein